MESRTPDQRCRQRGGQSGQMALGGLLFLALAGCAAVGFLSLATSFRSAQRAMAHARDDALARRTEIAALLNELSMGQALALWHLHGALRAQQVFRDAALLSAVTRPYWKTPALTTTIEMDAGIAALRNALSQPSSRHLLSADAVLTENARTVERVERLAPGFLSRVEPFPVESFICLVAKEWLSPVALQVPGTGLLLRASVGTHRFLFDEGTCSFTFSSGISNLPSFVRQVTSPGEQWQAFESALGRTPRSFYLPRDRSGESAFSRHSWVSVFTHEEAALDAAYTIETRIVHPSASSAGALFDPRWSASLGAVKGGNSHASRP